MPTRDAATLLTLPGAEHELAGQHGHAGGGLADQLAGLDPATAAVLLGAWPWNAEAVLAELQRLRGNAFVQQVLALFHVGQRAVASTEPTQSAQVCVDDPVLSTAQVETLVRQVVDAGYPELAASKFRVREFHEAGFYFQCKPAFGNLFRGDAKDVYTVEVNPDAFDGTLSVEACKGILAHEIAHGLNVHQHGLGGFIDLGTSYLSKQHLHTDERQTDLEAIIRGFGAGLAAYRRWIYQRLTADQLATKKATYYQPEEILAIQQSLAAHPDLAKQWRRHPPRDLATMTVP